jgi:16S rRNA (guanine527-N7)-methyltransferase
MNMKEILQNATKNFKINLSNTQLEQFETYFRLLVEWNEKINLTAITDAEGVAVKHFADCLTFFNHIEPKNSASIIDVGTGAGFPGVVLKIARPDINLTLLDSLNKRLVFLQEVLDKIGLDAQIIHSRAEDGANKPELRESFDFAVSRAVAQLNVLSEYCLPYVKVGGSFVALKGPSAKQEIANADKALNILGGKVKASHEFTLPLDGSERTIIEISKAHHTPKTYPRNSGKIKSIPL